MSHRTNKITRRSMAGFTLVEIMIVVAIIGILSAIAYPSYVESVQRGDRSAARVALLQGQQFMERFYAANSRYTTDAGGTIAPTLPTTVQQVPVGGTPKHDITLTAVALNSYTLTADPRAASDGCGNLTLTNTGVKGRSGSGLSVQECWR